MDFNRHWTTFALSAEHDDFGMLRIAKAHNALFEERDKLRADLAAAREEVAKCRAIIERLNAGCDGCIGDDGDGSGCSECFRWGHHNPDLYESADEDVESRR